MKQPIEHQLDFEKRAEDFFHEGILMTRANLRYPKLLQSSESTAKKQKCIDFNAFYQEIADAFFNYIGTEALREAIAEYEADSDPKKRFFHRPENFQMDFSEQLSDDRLTINLQLSYACGRKKQNTVWTQHWNLSYPSAQLCISSKQKRNKVKRKPQTQSRRETKKEVDKDSRLSV